MIKAKLFASKKCKSDGEVIFLYYYITEKKIDRQNLYGVKVEKFISVNGEEVLDDEDGVYDVTEDYNIIKKIMDALVKGLVMPYSLIDVVDEMV